MLSNVSTRSCTLGACLYYPLLKSQTIAVKNLCLQIAANCGNASQVEHAYNLWWKHNLKVAAGAPVTVAGQVFNHREVARHFNAHAMLKLRDGERKQYMVLVCA